MYVKIDSSCGRDLVSLRNVTMRSLLARGCGASGGNPGMVLVALVFLRIKDCGVSLSLYGRRTTKDAGRAKLESACE